MTNCYWSLKGNGGPDPNLNFLGTTDDRALTLRVHNQVVMRYFPHAIGPDGGNLVGGAHVNSATGGAGLVICGGGDVGLANLISNDHGAIVGGLGNLIEGRECFVGGGWGNTISDPDLFSTHCAVISGGSNNLVNVDFGSIGGGNRNTIQSNALAAAILGGADNSVSGLASAVLAGEKNSVAFDHSVVSALRCSRSDRQRHLLSFGGGWEAPDPAKLNKHPSGVLSPAAGPT